MNSNWSASAPRPSDVGITHMEVYFPQHFVSHADLEQHDGVSAGKYTVGLGQTAMTVVSDREDIYSMCLTAVSRLMRKYNISYSDVGRLEVATETVLDHSKSIKTVLMQLFEPSGNTDVEGIDSLNACYSGTAAFFNSIAWVESADWDGRYAMVVCADIAEYAPGPARPTSGAGAVAFLVGPDAVLAMERGCRASHMEHSYDFYKPHLSSPYPEVDGRFSNSCYLRSLDVCYGRYQEKARTRLYQERTLHDMQYLVFHSPYNKLVQKSYARLLYNDFLRHPSMSEFQDRDDLQQFRDLSPEESYASRPLMSAFTKLSKSTYATKVQPTTLLPKQLGNAYTASLYAGLVSLIAAEGGALEGKRVLVFSYGSGLASSMFSLVGRHGKQLDHMQSVLNLERRLGERVQTTPEKFHEWVDASARHMSRTTHSFTPTFPLHQLQRVSEPLHYLVHKDEHGRREYAVCGGGVDVEGDQ